MLQPAAAQLPSIISNSSFSMTSASRNAACPTIGPSAVRETLHRSFPKEMDVHDIDRVVKAYGAAARRSRESAVRRPVGAWRVETAS